MQRTAIIASDDGDPDVRCTAASLLGELAACTKSHVAGKLVRLRQATLPRPVEPPVWVRGPTLRWLNKRRVTLRLFGCLPRRPVIKMPRRIEAYVALCVNQSCGRILQFWLGSCGSTVACPQEQASGGDKRSSALARCRQTSHSRSHSSRCF